MEAIEAPEPHTQLHRLLSDEMDRLIDQQSQELDRAKRRKLEADVARPMLGWRKECFARGPHVPPSALYNYGRMQEVWLDR